MITPKWNAYNPALPAPEGIVHVLFSDTEVVVDATEVDWNAGIADFDPDWESNLEKRVVCYAVVDLKYKHAFDAGSLRVIESQYLRTSQWMRMRRLSAITKHALGILK